MATEESSGAQAPRWVMKIYTKVNVWVYRLSRGKRMNRLQGKPICLVTMRGAKSGKKRTVPLMYVPHENGFLLVASQGGAPKNPAWYYNLKKNPAITIEYEGVTYPLVARQLNPEEKAQVWSTCVAYWPAYADYQQRTTRDIPVFLCAPEADKPVVEA